MKIHVLWDVMPCQLVSSFQQQELVTSIFRHSPGWYFWITLKWRLQVPPKH